MRLINQKTSRTNRKVQAATIGGVVAVVVAKAIMLVLPGWLGALVPQEMLVDAISGAIALTSAGVMTWASGYYTRERAE